MTALSPLFSRRVYAALFACGLAALLAACFILPGKFTSTLDIRKDGHFTYTYQGEIFLLMFSELSDANKPDTFEPSDCYDDKTAEQHECTQAELAKQRKEWDSGAAERASKHKRELEEMRVFLGGIDPSDPKAADKFAEKLQQQAGWRRVTNKGHGIFDVDFSTSGVLTYDFTFPSIEQMNNSTPFVQLSVRKDGSVRLDAPAFGAQGTGPMQALMGKSLADSSSEKDMPNFPKVSGTFTLTTDAAILSNNTDQGPQSDPAGKKLQWTVGDSSKDAAPMALLQLDKR